MVVDPELGCVIAVCLDGLDLPGEFGNRKVHGIHLGAQRVPQVRMQSGSDFSHTRFAHLHASGIAETPDAAPHVASAPGVRAGHGQAILAQFVDGEIPGVSTLRVKASRFQDQTPGTAPDMALAALRDLPVDLRLDLRLFEFVGQRVGTGHHDVTQKEIERCHDQGEEQNGQQRPRRGDSTGPHPGQLALHREQAHHQRGADEQRQRHHARGQERQSRQVEAQDLEAGRAITREPVEALHDVDQQVGGQQHQEGNRHQFRVVADHVAL